ncbi:hypothetical protein ACFL41_00630 [Gemmatimonadota bacterium]
MRLSHLGILIVCAAMIPAETVCQHEVIHSDIDGIPLVRTEGGPKFDGPLFEIERDLVLGIDEGEPEWQIFWASPLLMVAPDGRMVLIAHRKCEVYIVSKDGDLIARTGGPGSGPGEFRQPWFYSWYEPGESFIVDDRSLNRATRISMTGELLDTQNYGHQMERRWQAYIALGNGRYLGHHTPGEGGRTVGRPIEFVNKYFFMDSEFGFVEDFIDLRYSVSFATSPNGGAGIPFLRAPGFLAFPDGRILQHDPEEGRLTIRTTYGEPILHFERDWERKRVSARDREEGRKRFLESDQPYMRRVASRIPFPSRYSAFSRVITDDRGRIWVEYVDGPYQSSILGDHFTFDVFGPDGVWLGVQELEYYPTRIRGDYLYRRGAIGDSGSRIQRFHLRPLVPEAAGEIPPSDHE